MKKKNTLTFTYQIKTSPEHLMSERSGEHDRRTSTYDEGRDAEMKHQRALMARYARTDARGDTSKRKKKKKMLGKMFASPHQRRSDELLSATPPTPPPNHHHNQIKKKKTPSAKHSPSPKSPRFAWRQRHRVSVYSPNIVPLYSRATQELS